jgi:hypothetical protein
MGALGTCGFPESAGAGASELCGFSADAILLIFPQGTMSPSAKTESKGKKRRVDSEELSCPTMNSGEDELKGVYWRQSYMLRTGYSQRTWP